MDIKEKKSDCHSGFNLESTLACHPRATSLYHPRASIARHEDPLNNEFNIVDSRVKHENDNRVCESGRSMTEMLGTLTIIGALSIGAIAGYSYGMNKYRANETTQDINLRMMDLITQLSQHSDTDPNLANTWGTKGKFYEMDVVLDEENAEYALEVSGVPQQVCQMVFDNLITSYSIEIDTTRYAESTTGDICGDTNTMAFYSDNAGTRKCGNIVCNKNQYCHDTNESSDEPHPSDTCSDLNFNEITIDDTTYYVSGSAMSWWDADSACRALGKEMITISELATNEDGSAWTGGTGYYTRTDLATQLRSLVHGEFVLTSDPYDTYRMYGMGLGTSYVGYTERNHVHNGRTSRYAVCR